MDGELIDYPILRESGLEVSDRYLQIQRQGLVKIKLPFGDPAWLATRYEDVRMVFGDHRFSRSMALGRNVPGLISPERTQDPSLLLNQDPPQHNRMRRLAANPFTPGHVAEYQGWIQSVVDDLLDDLAAVGPGADFVATYTSNFSLRVLARILGIPRDKAEDFRKWVEIAAGLDTPPATRNEATQRTFAFIQEQISAHRAQSSNDMIGDLVRACDDGRLSEAELASMVLQFWIGGFKTSAWQLGSMVYALMTHPDHWRELVENPKMLPAALEELWRWVPAFQYGFIFVRFAREDVEFSDGTLVRAGEAVLPESPVANRDETIYVNASKLDFHRVDPAPHLTFNHGAHTCIGKHLARMQIRLTIEGLMRRFPNLSLAVAPETLRWSQSSLLRSVETLPLKW